MPKVKTIQITPEMRAAQPDIDEHLNGFGIPSNVPVIFYIKNDQHFLGRDKHFEPGEAFTITVDVFEENDERGSVLFTTHNCTSCAAMRIECVIGTTPFFIKNISITRSKEEDKMWIEMDFNFMGPNIEFLSKIIMIKALTNIKEKEVTNEPS